MAFTDYASLQVEIEDWLNRPDLSAKLPTFITLCESRVKRMLRRKTVRATLTVSAESNALPADCAELRSVRLMSSTPWLDKPLAVCTPEQLADFRMGNVANGRPVAASIIAGNLVVAPTPDTSYSADITYFQQLTALSGSNTSNSILVESPDVYLYGSLAEAAPYLQHDERLPVWNDRYEAAIAELNDVREREELSASLRPVRLRQAF